jgi:threonine dehydrogenase-like Zn-dependent dehydrogenase
MEGKRVRFTAPGIVSVEAFEVGKPAADEVLIETLYTTISPGTERSHLLAEENTVTRSRGFPFQPGYSNVGRVLETGSAVTNLRPGQLVASSLPHVSHAVLTPVTGPDVAGGKSRYKSDLPPEASFAASPMLWPLPADLDERRLKACSTYCFSRVGLHGVRKARIELGEAVLVLGLGPIGLHTAQYARLAGGLPVLGLDPSPARRRFAADLGLDGVYAHASELAAGHALMSGTAPAVVIEATGLPEVIPQAFRLCARNGRVILLGSTRGPTAEVNFYTDVHKKGLLVYGVHASIRPHHESSPGHWTVWDDVSVILRLIGSGRVNCESLITHEFRAEDAAEAYRVVQDSPEAIAVVLKWKS